MIKPSNYILGSSLSSSHIFLLVLCLGGKQAGMVFGSYVPLSAEMYLTPQVTYYTHVYGPKYVLIWGLSMREVGRYLSRGALYKVDDLIAISSR